VLKGGGQCWRVEGSDRCGMGWVESRCWMVEVSAGGWRAVVEVSARCELRKSKITVYDGCVRWVGGWRETSKRKCKQQKIEGGCAPRGEARQRLQARAAWSQGRSRTAQSGPLASSCEAPSPSSAADVALRGEPDEDASNDGVR
jgi:hypothetical protein